MSPGIEVFGQPTPSDLRFIRSATFSFPSSDGSSTESDAESAPPELDLLFKKICNGSAQLLHESHRQLPPEWDIPDLIRNVIGNEALVMPGVLRDTYYDLILRGSTSWLFEDLTAFLDLVNYVS